jgi:lysophospholipase L1-like esterase
MNAKSKKLSISTIAILLTMAIFLWSVTLPQRVQAASTPIKVMPLGDSITDGFTVSGGYRTQLYSRVAADGLTSSLDFVGSMSSGPGSLLDREHEGLVGWSIGDLAGSIDGWMTSYTPKVVMLMIGTNDILHSLDMSTAPNRLSSLIDQICAKLPAGGKVYVAQITPLTDPTYNALVNQYNAAIPGVVQSKVTQGKPVFLVNMNSVITISDLSDGIHPTQAGYDKMGNAWYAIIKNDLVGGPVLTPTRTNTAGPTNTSTRTSTVTSTPTKTNTPGITSTPTRTATKTNTPAVSNTPTSVASPTRTNTPGSGTTCSPVNSTITAPFTFDGAGTFCWQSTNLGSYMNSWNTTSVTINSVNISNVYMAVGSYPAKIGGFWYVTYNGPFAWSHFEAK